MCQMQARAQGTAGQAASGLWAVTALIGVAGAVLTLVA
jgi:hypothetical protein